MLDSRAQAIMGIVTIAASLFLIFLAIPRWVASPSNVSNIILSPLFWPYALALVTMLIGLGMLAMSRRKTSPTPNDEEDDEVIVAGGYQRLSIMGVIMILYVFALPWLGMVWTSMLAFVSVSFLVRTTHPKATVISAIVIPLVLYAFFAHVAGVGIPQGELVRLP